MPARAGPSKSRTTLSSSIGKSAWGRIRSGPPSSAAAFSDTVLGQADQVALRVREEGEPHPVRLDLGRREHCRAAGPLNLRQVGLDVVDVDVDRDVAGAAVHALADAAPYPLGRRLDQPV